MFNARSIKLTNGQYYDLPVILERKDYEAYGVFDIAGTRTLAFLANGTTITLNQSNLLHIMLDNRQRIGQKANNIYKIVLADGTSYEDCRIVSAEEYEYAIIPKIICDGMSQVVWSCADGTFITPSTNIASMIDKNPNAGRSSKVVPRNALHVQPDVLGEVSAQSIHKKIG